MNLLVVILMGLLIAPALIVLLVCTASELFGTGELARKIDRFIGADDGPGGPDALV